MRILFWLSIFFSLFIFSVLAAEPANSPHPDWIKEFHTYLINPNVVYLLILLAIYGIFFEIANPGMIVPGFTGAVALLFVLYAFHLVPINFLGVFLILLGVGFMITEVYVTSFGIIGMGGVIAFIIGSILLFDTPDDKYAVAWPLILAMSVLSFTFVFIILTLAIKSHKREIVSGREGLIESEGVVLSVMNEQIVVRVLGEIWEAKSSQMLIPGDKIKVTKVQGLTLFVEPVEKKKGE